MRVRLVAPPWGAPPLTAEALVAIQILGDNVWAESSVDFYASRSARIHAGKRAPKGMQQTLNRVIDERFCKAKWEGEAGCFVKGSTWVRITFRHQMSLGSDIIDAMKVCKKEGVSLAIILAANRATLNLITPNDAGALVSFEKLQNEVFGLNGVIDIPLVIGELTPMTSASPVINDAIRRDRPRDVTVPSESSDTRSNKR